MKIISLLSLFFALSISFAQTFTSTSYENLFSGTSVNGNGQSWNSDWVWGSNSITYAQNDQLEITFVQSSWVAAQNFFDSPIDISGNRIVEMNASFSIPSKYILLELIDVNNRTTGVGQQSIFSLETSSSQFVIDFNSTSSYNFDFTNVKGLRIHIVNDAFASTVANLNGETLTITSLRIGGETDPNDLLTLPRWSGDQQNINIFNTNTGNVGIGTTSADEPTLTTPYYKFTVAGRTNIIAASNAFNIWHPITLNNGYRPYMVLGHESFSDGTVYGVIGVNAYNGSTGIAKPHHLLLQTNSFDGGGALGIGSFINSPTSKLSIKAGNFDDAIAVVDVNEDAVFKVTNQGVVWATEVNIDLGPFPDYVFDEDYQLLSLESLSDSIKINGHLPNFPSGQQIEQDEVGIGEITRLQQEKIEELTLYLLILKKELEELRDQIKN